MAFLEVDRQDDAQRDDSGHKDVDDDVLLESAKYTILISYLTAKWLLWLQILINISQYFIESFYLLSVIFNASFQG